LRFAAQSLGTEVHPRTGGRANSGRHYVTYWLMAGNNFLDARVPQRTMGVADAGPTKITIGDAQWLKSAIFSLEAR